MRQTSGPFPGTVPFYPRAGRSGLVLWLPLLIILLLADSPSFACEESNGFQACLSYYTEDYLRLPQVNRTLFRTETGKFFTKHADGVMRQRNEFRLYLHYAPDPEKYTLGVPHRIQPSSQAFL